MQLHTMEMRGDVEVHVQMNTSVVTDRFVRGVQLDTRVVSPMHRDLQTTFLQLNDLANSVFDELIPETEFHRFGGAHDE